MRAAFSVRARAYGQLGVRAGTATALRRVGRAGRGRVRALAVERRPVRVTEAELDSALAGRTAGTALQAWGEALPAVGRFTENLDRLSPDARRNLLARADVILEHRFDLLGSGPVALGPRIDWHRDFKSGRAWPLRHISKLVVSYPDASDIKVPWELSRCQHLPLLAGAYRISGERRYLDEIGAQLEDWIAANPVEIGVNWACTMDVAIRSINWAATLVVCADAAAETEWARPVLGSLLLHARFIRGHLEYGPARGNHYLSDVVGLLVCAGPFSASDEGRRWVEWAVDELGVELRHQVRNDGCDHEASTAYHRLVTELFIVGADAAEALAPGRLDPIVRERLDRMLGFVTDYTRPDGLAPQLGDADDGRLLPLGDYGHADQRSHLHLFAQAGRDHTPATASAAYPDGGFYILRGGDLYAAVRCGDVGIHGMGCHAHNDLLAFELACGATPVVVDPGSYLYTADPDARNAFRSTAVHSALQIDAAEQNEIRTDRLFAMVDRAHGAVTRWEPGPQVSVLEGGHRGFESLPSPARYRRTLTLDAARRTLQIVDEVIADAAHELSLTLPLAPCRVLAGEEGVTADFGAVRAVIRADGLTPEVSSGWLSPGYGRRQQAPVIRLTGRSRPGVHRTTVTVTLVTATGAE